MKTDLRPNKLFWRVLLDEQRTRSSNGLRNSCETQHRPSIINLLPGNSNPTYSVCTINTHRESISSVRSNISSQDSSKPLGCIQRGKFFIKNISFITSMSTTQMIGFWSLCLQCGFLDTFNLYKFVMMVRDVVRGQGRSIGSAPPHKILSTIFFCTYLPIYYT